MNSLRLFGQAAVLGGLHAAFSLYWPLGGGWLLDTVSSSVIAAVKQSPLGASLTLALAAVIPWLSARRRLPWPRL